MRQARKEELLRRFPAVPQSIMEKMKGRLADNFAVFLTNGNELFVRCFHRYSDGKLIGVLDFNNMIPVRDDVLQKMDVKIHPNDSAAVKHYKNLVIDQLNFCQRNQEIIIAKANKLYRMVSKKNATGNLKRRCLNWSKLETVLQRYPKKR